MKRHRLASGILGIVGAFVLLVACTLIAKSRTVPVEPVGPANLEIRKNVVITSNDGLKLETSVLRWQAAEKRLWSDAPVRLSRDGATAEGTALDVRTADGALTLTGRVRTTFSGGGQ